MFIWALKWRYGTKPHGGSTDTETPCAMNQGIFSLRQMLDELRTFHDFDHAESKRVELKQAIRMSPPEERATLEERLRSLEDYWVKLERERSWRHKAIAWLKNAIDTELSEECVMAEIPLEALVAFVLSATISPDSIKIRWIDNTTLTLNRDGLLLYSPSEPEQASSASLATV